MYYILTFRGLDNTDDTVQIIIKNDDILTVLEAYAEAEFRLCEEVVLLKMEKVKIIETITYNEEETSGNVLYLGDRIL